MTGVRRVRLSQVCSEDRDTVRPGERPDLRYVGLESIEPNTGRFISEGLSKTPDAPRAVTFYFNQTHVLYGKLRPYLNKVALPDFEGKCSTEIVPLRPSSEIDRAYLAYFLRSAQTVSHINAKTSGARMPRADMEFVLGLELDLPQLDEQRRIVDILSRAEGIVRLQRQAAEKASEIIPALFLDIFGDPAANPKGWPKQRLGALAEHMSDGPFGSNLKTAHYTETGVRVIRLQNIGVGSLNDEDKAFISHEHFASLERHRCVPGDVIIGTLGDPNLRAIVLPPSIPEALNKADCVQFHCRTDAVLPEYICWLMNMPSTLAMAAQLVQGITRTRISMGRLREMFVPVPPVQLQKIFSRRVTETRGILAQRDVSLRTGDILFQALLVRAFAPAEDM